MLFSFLVFASPMLIPIITKQLSTSAQADKNLFYYALYVFRNSNHYFPSFFPAINYYKSALILLLSAGLILFYSHPQKKTLLLFFGVIVFGMFCFWLVFEKFKIYESGKLQWFKTSTWLTAMCAIIISGYLGKMFGSFFQVNKKIIYTVVIWCVLLFIAITNSAFLPSKKLKSKFRIGNYQKSDLTLMHEWIKQNTPVDALMLSFPGDDSFLCEAQRPMPVAFKAIIHEPWFMNKWYDDFKSFYSLNDSINFYSKNAIELASKSFRKTDNSEFLKQKGIKYRLINLAELDYQIQENKIIHKQGNYVLEQL
jgi:hypothetical protein